MTDREYAQIAYRAYGDSVDWLNVRGEAMPSWDGLGKKIQVAWVCAARVVREAAS